MRCAEFRDQHCSFVDDTLAGVELIRMQRHIAECPECATLDARVRRSLMLVRNLPPVQPSGEFSARLEAKLRACRESCGTPVAGSVNANFNTVGGLGVVASMVMLGYMAVALREAGPPPPRDVILPPVVAVAEAPRAEAPELRREPHREPTRSTGSRKVTNAIETPEEEQQPEIVRALQPAPAIIASVSAGIPLWPAALFAEQAPLHFASYRGDNGPRHEVH